MLVLMTTTLSSFSTSPGGDTLKVYLNDKLLFKQFVNHDPSHSISLNEATANDQLIVYYDHCGSIGTGRTICLFDGQQELKKWTFKDTKTESLAGMSCKVSEIKSFQKAGKSIRLMYDSKELRFSTHDFDRMYDVRLFEK